MRRSPYITAAPVTDAPPGWSVLPIGDVNGSAHAAVFDRRVHDICQTPHPFSVTVTAAIEQRGWFQAATADDGTQFWLRDRAAVAARTIVRARRVDRGRTLA